MNQQLQSARNSIDRFFSLTERNTSLRTEVLAGLSTYVSLAYIIIVNPAILSQAGMNPSAVLFATAVASGLATIFMGLYARLPFALAPGLEMNGFVAFVVVGVPTATGMSTGLGLSWQQALGAVFWSGVLCWVFSVIPLRKRIVDAIPLGLQSNLAVSVGVFVAVVGLFLAKIVAFKEGRISSFNFAMSVEVVTTAGSGLLIISSLMLLIPAAIPRTRGPRSGARSLIYFQAIAEQTAEQYAEQVEGISSEDYLTDLISQCHRNAEIAASKYRFVRWSIWLLAPGIPFWAIAILILRS